MSIQAYLSLTLDYSVWIIYTVLNILYVVSRGLYWRYTGVHQQIQDCKKPENYKRCAHVQRIIFRHKIDAFFAANVLQFVTVHERFMNPEDLLHEKYTLFSLNETEVTFVEEESGWPKPLYEYDFFFLGQSASAVKLITVPMNQFHKLAEEMEGDGGKLIFLQNQARSGGTLLTSIFKECGRCVCFNEPHAFTILCRMIYDEQAVHGEYTRKLFRNVVRMICKPIKNRGEPVLAYVMKPTIMNICSIPLCEEVFPDAMQLFMYRDARTVSISLRRIGEVLNTLKLMYYLPSIPNSLAFLVNFIGYPSQDLKRWTPTDITVEFGYYTASLSMFHYLKGVAAGIDIKGIRYSDLVANKTKMIRDIFKSCDLPESLVAKGEEAMAKDSQADSPVSMSKLKLAIPNPPKFNPERIENCRLISKQWGVPEPEQWDDLTFRLPNSILP